VLAGQSNKLIAGELEISEYTVKVHLQHIYRKLGVHRRLELLKVRG
jgi:DNA-binding CsgD family transcriptional regulator